MVLGWLGAMVSAMPDEEPLHALPLRRLPLVRNLEVRMTGF